MRRVLSTKSYDEMPENLRKSYPINDIWDAKKNTLIGRPFRFKRLRDSMLAVFNIDGETISISIVDARNACLAFKMLSDKSCNGEAHRMLAAVGSSVAHMALSEAEPHMTTVLRSASSNYRRSVGQVGERIHTGTTAMDDGCNWKRTVELWNTTPVFSNPSVASLKLKPAHRACNPAREHL